ncbi:hypothetical protein RO1_22750 [Roseburia intestinalis XB6B4]|jgi:hypothetical protein|uniref:Uncharacterized protein n=2 Tax=Roseburia intestinalis TaxID=166486 RepID=C7GEW4_9FIRM|nr:hypothetical protein ROSINTL182_08466 [Roseburia intestinalis L1-82]CBL12778.1 hypothetical protein RO1_22750 [Roseburia intestinalis XB6B4]
MTYALVEDKRAVRDVPSLVRQGLFRYYIRKQSLFYILLDTQ